MVSLVRKGSLFRCFPPVQIELEQVTGDTTKTSDHKL